MNRNLIFWLKSTIQIKKKIKEACAFLLNQIIKVAKPIQSDFEGLVLMGSWSFKVNRHLEFFHVVENLMFSNGLFLAIKFKVWDG